MATLSMGGAEASRAQAAAAVEAAGRGQPALYGAAAGGFVGVAQGHGEQAGNGMGKSARYL